jgi:hypothetical protein
MNLMHVNAAALNIRASSGMVSDNVVANLPFGHPLQTIGEHDLKRWIAVEANYVGKLHRGFVNVGYLRKPLSVTKESLLATAARAWSTKDSTFKLPAGDSGFARDNATTAKPAIGDVICAANNSLVVARGMTQVWALGSDLQIIKFALLEDGRLDDPHGKITAVLRNLA